MSIAAHSPPFHVFSVSLGPASAAQTSAEGGPRRAESLLPFWQTPTAALVLCVVFFAVAVASIWHKGLTFDEPRHVTAGYSYWKTGDFRLDPETGMLANRLLAVPLLTINNPLPPTDSDAWQFSDERRAGDAWFNQSTIDTIALTRRGRAGVAIFAVLLGVLTWRYARQLGGAAAGALALSLYVTNPTVLANGPLMTSDVMAATFFLTAAMLIWALLHTVTARGVALSAFSVGALFAVKNSALVILPVAAILILIRLVGDRPLSVGLGKNSRSVRSRLGRFGVWVGIAAVHLVVGVELLWTLANFRFSAFATGEPPARFPIPWEDIFGTAPPLEITPQLQLTPAQLREISTRHLESVLSAPVWTSEGSVAFQSIRRNILNPTQSALFDQILSAPGSRSPQRVLKFCYGARLLPESYLYGISQTWLYSQGYPAFLNGEVSVNGWRRFFPYTFLVKTPIITLVLLAVAAALLVRRVRLKQTSRFVPETPLWVFVAVYLSVCVTSRLNIGHRHLLPLYPPLFILTANALIEAWSSTVGTRRRVIAAGLALALVVQGGEMIFRFPHYLAYFNGVVAPNQAYRHLVDSSLDWGQELPAVATYLARQPGTTPVYLAYFGLDRPAKYGIKATPLFALPGYYVEDALLLGKRVAAANVASEVRQLREERPDFEIVGTSQDGPNADLLLARRAESLALHPGLYVISATLLQPVYLSAWKGDWNARYEADYQDARQRLAPYLTASGLERARRLNAANLKELQETWRIFREVRFARLTAFLRTREPDDEINFGLLVYRLTATDLAQALEGPPPFPARSP